MKSEIKYIPVHQKDYTFFNSVIDVRELLELTQVVERTNDHYEKINVDIFNLESSIEEVNSLKLNAGIQRELIPNKLSQIADYLKGDKGLFPNSVIINISDRLELVEFNESIIEIPHDPSIVVTALDGQHRLQGYKKYLEKYNNKEVFQVPVTIFYNTELDFQAYIFSIINSKQTKINKSLLYDLLALTKSDVDEFKLSHELAGWLHTNNDSILKGNFKMLGKGDGWLSQAAFIDYLMPLIHGSKRRKIPAVFEPYKESKKYYQIAYFINDYFKSLINCYNKEFYSDEYIFRTSFIFGLFMKFMPYVFVYSFDSNELIYSQEKIDEIFRLVKQINIDFKKGGANSGVGSIGRQNKLLNELIDSIKQHGIDFEKEMYKYKKYIA